VRHDELVKDNAASTYKKAIDNVIKFYNSHEHTVHTIHCDAGSTENDESI